MITVRADWVTYRGERNRQSKRSRSVSFNAVLCWRNKDILELALSEKPEAAKYFLNKRLLLCY
jgi:hypothetical protein